MSDSLNKHYEDVPRYLRRDRISYNQINNCPVGEELPVFPAQARAGIGNFIPQFLNVRCLLTAKIESLLHVFRKRFQLNCNSPLLIFGEWRISSVGPYYVNGKLSATSYLCPKIGRISDCFNLVCPLSNDWDYIFKCPS